MERALTRQADLSQPWGLLWGDLVEMARAKQLVDDQTWQTYLSQAVLLTLHPRMPIRVGDPIMFMVEEEYRVGQQASLHLWILASVPVLEDAAADPGPPLTVRPATGSIGGGPMPWDEPWGGLHWTRRAIRAMPPGQVYREARVPGEATRHLFRDAQDWPTAAAEGTYRLRLAIDVRVYDQVDPSVRSRFPIRTPPGEASQILMRLSAPVEVVSSADAMLKPRRDAQLDGLIASSIWIAQIHTSGQQLAFVLRCSSLPTAIAADAFVRLDGRELSLGSVTSRPTVHRLGDILIATGRVEDAFRDGDGDRLKDAALILRPSEEAARETAHIWEYYGGEIIFEGLEEYARPVPPERSP